MKRPNVMRWLASGSFLLVTAFAHAGGPLAVCNSAGIKYPGAGTVTLNYDQGALGSLTKAQADALVTAAISVWPNVATTTVRLERGADLPVDVTAANYFTYLNSADGLNPVIYDTDGSILDLMLGVGAKAHMLGLAGSNYSDSTCQYAEGHAVISGYISVPDATMQVLVAHEIGHLIGLGHTQLNANQNLNSANFPVMYPIIYRAGLTLHEDDAAAVSALYPGPSLNSAYGELSGNLTQASGSPILGANIWAREINTDKVYSVVSDYLMQGTGYFRLLLPAGTYDLHAEAIARAFTGASGVGPYAGSLADSSFQPPLYDANGAAMAPVTLGGGTPIKFVIAAGCNSASTVFKMDGTGSLSSSCQLPPDNQSPSVPSGLSATAITSSQINLAWTASTDNVGVTAYNVFRGGVVIANLGNVTNYSNSGLAASTLYTYTVQACDAAGNCSARSAATSPATTVTTCTYSLPANQAVTAGVNTGTLNVTSPLGCGWGASINVEWITITSIGGSGNGTVAYAVAANPDSSSRIGTLTIAGQPFTVTQAGLPAPTFQAQSDCFFSWAERTYPNWFGPAGAISNTLAPYYYRFYLQTNAYLAISSADNHVYYLGPLSSNSILDVGALSDWLATAGCA